MKKKMIGISFGVIAGIIDVIPMILKKLTWDANISAMVMWVVVGFFIATVDINVQPILKGILIALLVLLPSGILIGWKEPKSFPSPSLCHLIGKVQLPFEWLIL